MVKSLSFIKAHVGFSARSPTFCLCDLGQINHLTAGLSPRCKPRAWHMGRGGRSGQGLKGAPPPCPRLMLDGPGVVRSLGPLCGPWGPLVVIVDIAGPSQLPSPGSEAAQKQQGGQGEQGQHPRTEAGQGLHLAQDSQAEKKLAGVGACPPAFPNPPAGTQPLRAVESSVPL